MDDVLEKRFEIFEFKLNDLKKNIELNCVKIFHSIESVLDFTHAENVFNKKRQLLLDQTYNDETKALKKALPLTYLSFLNKSKYTASQKHIFNTFVRNLSRLFYKNDFKVYQKFRFYHLFNSVTNVKVNSQLKPLANFYIVGDKMKYIAYDENSNELLVIDESFNCVKTVLVKRKYYCCQIWINGDRILLHLVSHNPVRTYLYLCDLNLNPIRKSLFKSHYTFIKPTQNYFFCEHTNSIDLEHSHFIYNFNLDLVENYRANIQNADAFLTDILVTLNRVVLKHTFSSKIEIRTKDTLELVKSFSTKGYSRTRVFVDDRSNIYLIMFESNEHRFEQSCFDYNGEFLFKQNSIFSEFTDFFANDQTFYLFDNNVHLTNIF